MGIHDRRGSTHRNRRASKHPQSATCVVCGCTDERGCLDGCMWVTVDRRRKKGLCSSCVSVAALAVEALEAHRGTAGGCPACDASEHDDDCFQAKHKKSCVLGRYVAAAATEIPF
jgi:hypothetical protein